MCDRKNRFAGMIHWTRLELRIHQPWALSGHNHESKDFWHLTQFFIIYIYSQQFKTTSFYPSLLFLLFSLSFFFLPNYRVGLFIKVLTFKWSFFIGMQKLALIFIWVELILLLSFVFLALFWGFSCEKQPCLLLSITEVSWFIKIWFLFSLIVGVFGLL